MFGIQKAELKDVQAITSWILVKLHEYIFDLIKSTISVIQ